MRMRIRGLGGGGGAGGGGVEDRWEGKGYVCGVFL